MQCNVSQCKTAGAHVQYKHNFDVNFSDYSDIPDAETMKIVDPAAVDTF